MMAYSPEGQRLVSGSALSHGGSRERSGRGEFFTRSRMIGTTHSKARNVCSVSARYHASSFKAIMRGVPREKARSEPVVSAPPAPRRCPSAARRCLPRRCLAAYPSSEILLYYQQLSGIEPRGGGGRNESR